MDTEDALDAGRRLAAVVDHLGIEKAHIVVGQGSLQAFDLIRLRPGLVASLTFIQTPNVLDEETVKPFADRLLCIAATDPIPAQRRSLACGLDRLASVPTSWSSRGPGYRTRLAPKGSLEDVRMQRSGRRRSSHKDGSMSVAMRG